MLSGKVSMGSCFGSSRWISRRMAYWIRSINKRRTEFLLFSSPTVSGNIKTSQIKHTVHHGSSYIFQRCGLAVKGWSGRADDAAGQRDRFHIAYMHKIVRRIADYADQLPSFFKNNIGGPGDKIVGNTGGDPAQYAHGTGN